ncbi:pyridoxal phosphate homeostasis protein [Leptopilina boulardi]|uniref:pyridoxal phosphate homeostasis protein n=1 Tax=Leptopilina boulardi TaxID=63433 RepID=UPI0021F65394|nr:pyridoxal phosphate homeostasis protein [Leptopilina boulardi]
MLKMVEIATNLKIVREKIIQAAAKRLPELNFGEPILVAASKLKPPDDIIEAYNAGQKHFGENYVNELVEKANDQKILEQCKEIRWHYIGHLQRNKINKILGIKNLFIIETVDSEKLASALDVGWMKFSKNDDSKLKIMVQINTSNEAEKNGCKIEEAPSLVKYVLENCKYLEFVGLMTIGQYGYDLSKGQNPDFLSLVECRKNVCQELGLDQKNVQLSMGMSSDYEHAIELGSTSVRVGTSIFGERPKKT